MNNQTFSSAGWRAVIGLIKPAPGYQDISDFHRMAPEGVAISATVLIKPLIKTNVVELSKLDNYVLDAAKVVALAVPNVIVWNCTSGSFIKGYGYDQELIKKIQNATNILTTTTTTAVIAALKHLRISKICIVTPYIKEINKIEKKFFEDNGFIVLSISGLEIQDPYKISSITPGEVFRFVKSNDVPDADCLFISCTALETSSIIEPLEHCLKKPVVTSNQAAFWHCLQIVKIKEPIRGYGKLLCDIMGN